MLPFIRQEIQTLFGFPKNCVDGKAAVGLTIQCGFGRTREREKGFFEQQETTDSLFLDAITAVGRWKGHQATVCGACPARHPCLFPTSSLPWFSLPRVPGIRMSATHLQGREMHQILDLPSGRGGPEHGLVTSPAQSPAVQRATDPTIHFGCNERWWERGGVPGCGESAIGADASWSRWAGSWGWERAHSAT